MHFKINNFLEVKKPNYSKSSSSVHLSVKALRKKNTKFVKVDFLTVT